MKPNNAEAFLCELIGGLIEQWSMMLIDRAESNLDAFNTSTAFYLTEIDFEGPFNGKYHVFCQAPLVDALLSNLLGLDEDEIDEATRIDALQELTNVLAGNLLTACYGDDLVFSLCSPTARVVPTEQIESCLTQPVFCYLADDHPIGIHWVVSGEQNA